METNTVIVLFALVAGALAGAATITSLSAVQEASAAKECTDNGQGCWCYSTQTGLDCFGNKGDCQKAQRNGIFVTSGCYKINTWVKKNLIPFYLKW
jgi:hypothetical protein